MSEYRCLVLGLAPKGGMPPEEDPGKGMAIVEPGDYSKGYKVKQGNWQPNGIWVGIFESEAEAEKWFESTPGQEWLSKIRDVLKIKLKN